MLKLPVLGPASFSAAVAVFIVAVLNGALWSRLYGVLSPRSVGEWGFLVSFFLLQVGAYIFILRALSTPFLLKSIAVVLVITAAAASHFMREYGVVIDANMIRNVLQTDPAEARDLTTWATITNVFGFGVLPAAGILLTRVEWPEWRFLVRSNIKACLLALALVGANFAAFSGAYFSILRENRDVALTSTPANVFLAAFKLGLRSTRDYSGPITPIGADARIEPAPVAGARPLVTVVVVGETARAANFSLLGYERETNPGLKNTPGLIAFQQVSSCGTETATSVPCIFSGLGRARFSHKAIQRRENLLDVVQRAGLDVSWVDNQGGCKGVCARVPTVTTTHATDPRYCSEGECHDEILLEGLDERIAAMRKGGVIVLHMMGSHGPAYYKRVPAQMANFKPICETSQFSKCTKEQIVNSYDNTIAFTDHVLSRLVVLLQKASQAGDVDTTMLYVSDHGESLGENAVYLHGMPYVIAPDHQTHVPMLMWFSAGAEKTVDVEGSCVADLARKKKFTHDNVFHTMLGLHRIRTSIYDADLDVLEPCRRHRAM